MPSQNSRSKPTRSKRIGHLRSRLQALTEDYAPFFAGSPGAQWPNTVPSVAILTGLQQVRRLQLAFVPILPAQDEGDPGPVRF